MRRFFFGLVFLSLAACSSSPKSQPVERGPETSVHLSPEEADFQSAEALLEQHQNVQARTAFQKFQSLYPRSRFIMLARMGVAQSFEAEENWSEALPSYQRIHKLTVNEQPEIAARALYRMSFCYEALGEDARALAALLDSYRRGQLLPEEISKAEIPARLAMFYEKAQNQVEAEKYIKVAQKGISELQRDRKVSPQVLAKAYLEMGSVSLNQISASTFSSVVRAMGSVQVYPIRALALQISPWSEESLALLKKNYRDLWNTLVDMPGLSGVDEESIQRAKMEQQSLLGGEMLDLIQQANLYRPLDAERMNILERDLYKYLADLTLKIQDLIYRSEARMGLTLESQNLNGLKRGGRIKTDILLPEEKAPLPAKKKLKTIPPKVDQDPNL